MKIFIPVFALIASTFGTAYGSSGTFMMTDINILDVENQRIIPHREVTISRGVIVKIEAAKIRTKRALSRLSKKIRVIEGKGRYLTPGLIDAHVHLDLYYWNKLADDWSLPLYIANGVTAVRDAAGSDLTLKMRESILAKQIIGPRMVISSPFITSDPASAGTNVDLVTTREETEAKMKEYLAKGFDAVKVESGLNVVSNRAAADFLKPRGGYLFGHALYSKAKGYWEVLTEEVNETFRTIEHIGFLGDFLQLETSPYFHKSDIRPGALDWLSPGYMDFGRIPTLATLLKSKGTAVCPTLITVDYQLKLDTDARAFLDAGIDAFRANSLSQYYPDYYFDIWVDQYKTWGFGIDNPKRKELAIGFENEKKLVKLLDDAGVPIIAGTDTPARPYILAGFSLHDELAEYSSAGINSWSVLRMATVNSAHAMKMDGKIGVIKKSAAADLILTKKNPIADLSVLRRPDAVVSFGRYYNRKALDGMLASVKDKVRKMPRETGLQAAGHNDSPTYAHTQPSRETLSQSSLKIKKTK